MREEEKPETTVHPILRLHVLVGRVCAQRRRGTSYRLACTGLHERLDDADAS